MIHMEINKNKFKKENNCKNYNCTDEIAHKETNCKH